MAADAGPAKLVGNLAMRVLQRYYGELREALSSDPHQMAHEMYIKDLISKEERSRAAEGQGVIMTPSDKAAVLVEAIERRIAAENSSKPLMDFCRLLERRPGVGSIAARMKARLAYVQRHRHFPANDWSSDTECEQRPSSPGPQLQPPIENIPPAMQRYSQYLKDLYKKQGGMSLKWPPVLMKNFINLFCIGTQNKQDEHLTKQLVCGHADKVQETRTPINLSDLAPMKDGVMPSCILIQGAPGSGKTMFSWEVSRRWGQGNLLQQYPLVVMLPLRDPDVQNASKLEDLFPLGHKPYQQEVTAAVEQEAGKGVLLLLDGFDELPEDKRKGSSLLMNVITGKLLPLATVMVTSRPWALKTLLEPEHNPNISQHFEIVGFTTENVREYITKAFPDSTEERKFREYLRTYPQIGSIMNVPLNCAIVVEVYRSSRFTSHAPKTVTQLYTALVRTLLLRYLKDHPFNSLPDASDNEFCSNQIECIFKNLPSNVYHQLCNISLIAYQGLRNNQQLIFSDLSATFETLGLLQRVFQLHSDREASVSYNFLHLTVQEFLAAFHILQQGRKKQELHISGKISIGHPSILRKETRSHEVVCKFLAGLGGCMEMAMSWHNPEERLKLLNLLFESQNESLASRLLGNEDSIKRLTNPSISPHDMYVLGYCISVSNCQWRLSVTEVNDEHLEMMGRGFTSGGHSRGRIRSFHLSNGGLTSNGLCHLLSLPQHTLRDLTALELLCNKLDSRSCDMLSRHFPLSLYLEKIYLHRNPIGPGGHMPLIRAIPTAKYLHEVSFSSLSPEESWLLMSQGHVRRILLFDLSEDSVEAMAAALENHHLLVELTVRYSQFSPQNMATFSSSLATNSTLRELHLGHNNINCLCVQLLSQALHMNSTLEELDLSCNGYIKDRGGCSMAEALRVNKTLKTLEISGSPLGGGSIRQLIQSLRHNHVLNTLRLPYRWADFAEHLDGYHRMKSRIEYVL